ncbi:MAG: hypothetical protein ACI9GW_000968 [Halieaceae bacterium]|jgi:hypothetical protein
MAKAAANGERALTIYAGAEARLRLQKEGWHPDLFSLLVGASGGPKWFVLKYLDELMFGDFLAGGTRKLDLIGSSIGSWRHVCLTQPDPIAALDVLAKRYCEQTYTSKRPSGAEVSAVSGQMLEEIFKVSGVDGAAALRNHPRYHSHIVTARGGHFTGSAQPLVLAPSLGLAALANGIHRKALQPFFQRVLFSSPGDADQRYQPGGDLAFTDFNTARVALHQNNTSEALLASGSIPYVLAGERNIAGAPKGHYWDGGIIDYHFDLDFYRGDGLILYPQFSSELTSGWFDKMLPWRRGRSKLSDRMILLCPSDDFATSLPGGKIPDRKDFHGYEPEQRMEVWYAAMEASKVLAEQFAEQLSKSDPLDGVRFLPTVLA